MTKTAKTIDVHLPSGARVRVKRLDAQALSDVRELAQKLARGATFPFSQYQYLLDKQVTEVLDFGPYDELPADDKDRKKWPWRMGGVPAVSPDDWLEGDVNAISAAVYVARHGNELFRFRHMCQHCEQVLVVPVDVAERLTRGEYGGIRSYSREFLDAYAARATCSVEFDASFTDVDGDEIAFRWRPLIGVAEVERQSSFADAEKGQYTEIRGLAYKLVSLDGIDDRNGIVRRLKHGDETDMLLIADEFAEHEGGIENVVEVDCTSCGERTEAILPFVRLVVRDVAAPRRSRRGLKRRRR